MHPPENRRPVTRPNATRHPYLDHPGPIPFAHRGGGLEAAENTMAAFAHAVGLGYRHVETDLHATADGVLLVFHDDTMERLTGLTGPPAARTWADLRQARVHGREPIPLFSDVLDSWPELRLNLDPKTDGAAEALTALLRDRPALLDRVCVGSFSGTRLARMRAALGPGLCTSCGPGGVAALAARGIGLPAPRPAARAAQVPMRQWGIPVVTPGFLRAAHALGMAVHVWTIDDRAVMEHLLDLKVDGIMTDRPSLMREVFQERGLWQG
ncbi:MAG: hypothetical protein RLY86_804 [Pseudomonadota bacterium]|jgi:glycerophosphoryl diester phosphodiesterase